MPEGPEILYSSIAIKKYLKNYKFNVINSFSDNKVVVPTEVKKHSMIVNVDCKGKLLWLELENNMYLHIHYGLTGWLVNEKPDNYIKYELSFVKNTKEKYLFMRDKRRFSKIHFVNMEDHNKEIEKLGPDIFTKDFSIKYFETIISSKNTILASFLLDQKNMAGIGNYIKNESIYLTKLNVSVKTSNLLKEQIKNLYDNILFVAYSKLMTHLTENKIIKKLPKNKSQNKPSKLEIPYEFKVYDQQITKDNKKVIKTIVGGRDSYSTEEYINKSLTVKTKKSINEKGYNNKKIIKK